MWRRAVIVMVSSAVVMACAVAWSSASSAAPLASGATCSSADAKQAIASAQAYIAPLEKPQTKWLGPTTGPRLAPHKTVVVLYNNSTSWNINIARDAQALGKKIGWKVVLVTLNFSTDGTGLKTLEQAIALHPDAIIPPAVSPTFAGKGFLEAKAKGIAVVSAASLAAPGAALKYGIMHDVQLPPQQQAKALIDWAIADPNSGGCPRLIEWYTSQFAVANAKGQAFAAEAKACKTCTLLELVNNFTAMTTATGTSGLMSSWLQKYGSSPFYASAIADSNWDAALPALTAAKASKSTVHLMGSDGSVSSYQRISTGQYQGASTFMSADEQIWTLFDDLNRIFHHQPATTFNPRLLLVTHNNIKSALGPTSAAQYEPADGFKSHYLKIWGVK